jgi:hypothetical protein
MTIKFNGRDLVTRFKEDADNQAIRQYRIEYICARDIVVHYVKAEDNQGNDAQGNRIYKDVLSYAENEAAGLTRTPIVKLYSQNADLKWSNGLEIDAQNPLAVFSTAPNIVSTLTGVEVTVQTPADSDHEGVVAWVGTDSYVPLNSTTERYRGKAGTFSLQLPDDKTYYLRVAPYDAFGLDTFSAWDAQPIKRGDLNAAVGATPVVQSFQQAQAAIDSAVSKAQSDATKAQTDATKAQNDLAAAKVDLSTDIAAAKKAGTDASAEAAQVRADLVPTIATAKKAGDDASAAAQQVRTDLVPTIDAAKKAGTDAAAQASQISTDLANEVSRAKGAEGTLTTKVETAQRTADGAATSISTETTQRLAGDTALNDRVDSLKSRVIDNYAEVQTQITTLTDADKAIGQRIDTIKTSVDGNTTAITTEQKARSDGDGALGQRIDSVVTQANTDRADYTSKINSEATSRSDAVGAVGRRVDEVITQANTDRGNLNTRISDEATASSSRDAALGNRTQALESGFAGVSKLVLNENFDNDSAGWDGLPAGLVVPSSYGRRNVLRTPPTAKYNAVQGRAIAITSDNQRFKLRASWRCAAATGVYYFGVVFADENGNHVGASDGTGNYPLGSNVYLDSAIHGWLDREAIIGKGVGGSANGGTLAIPQGAVWMRPIMFLNYTDVQGSVTEVDYFTIEDVTAVEQANAAIRDEATTRAAQDSALSNRVATTEAQFRGEQDSTIAARIRDEATASANRDTAIGQRVDSVIAQANTDRGDLNTRITNEATASANRDAAIGSRTQLLESTATRLNDMALKTFPGFEVQADGWGYDTELRGRNNGAAWETHHTKGAGIAFPPGFGNFLYMDPYGWIKTTPGKRYRAGFWVWQWSAPNGYGGNARVYYEGQNKDHTDSSYLGITANAPETQRNFYEAIPNGAWHLYAFDYQVDDTTVSTASSYWIRPRINIDNAPAGAGYVIAGWFCREVTGEFSNAAKISDEATTRANQDSALGNRISTTEAQMRGDQDSWLAARVRDEATASSNRDGALGNRIGSVETRYSGAGNLVTNSELLSLDGWQITSQPPGTSFDRNGGGADWNIVGENSLTISENGTASALSEIISSPVSVTGGQYVQGYALGASHRSNNWVSIFFYKNDGTWNGYAGEFTSPRYNNGGRDMGGWDQTGIKSVRVPDGTATMRLALRKYPTRDNEYGSIAWFIRPYLGYAREGQTEWNPYSPGSGKASIGAANARITDEATASANRDGALSNRVSNTEAKLNGDQDSTLAARIRDEATASANRDSALGGRTSTLETSVSLIPETWRVRAFGNAAQGANRIAGLFRPDGYQIGETRRSYGVVAFAPGSNTAVLTSTFDVYGEGAAADGRGSLSMAQTLNGIPDGNTVIIYTCDEPFTHRFDNGLGDAMARCGAGEAYFASNFASHSAYVLIGRAGIGRGNGTEYYTGGYNADPNAYLEIPFTLTAGRAAVGANGGSRALSTKLADEQTARTTADNALGNRISTTEAQFRGEQDSWVAGRIRDEASASSNRDSALGNRISTTEAQFRGDSDSGLKTLINNKRKNMALVDWWKQGAGIPWGINGGTRNEIVQFPHGGNFDGIPLADGSSGDAWLCQGGADAAGGWNGGQMAPLNPDKTYRFVVPIAHLGGAGSRNAYWGVNGVCDLNTTNENGNPYFAVAGNMTPNRWHLFVGYLFPRNSNSKTHDGAGVWDAVTGAKVADGNNWTFKPDGSQPVHRAYQYYAYNGSFSAFGRPVVEEVDGSETNIAAILAAKQKAFAVDARVSDEATASANRDNALAGRIGTTEAQLNGSQGSWMAGRINDVDTASANRDSALAQRATTLEAAALVGSSSARNDHFAMWRDGQQHPDNWILWVAEGNYRTERVSGNGGSPYAVRTLNDNANVESGFYQQVPVYAGKWIVEVTAESDGSGFSGAGMTLHGVFNIDFLSDPDTKGYTGDQGNTMRTWNKAFDFDQNFINNIGGTVNFHAMHGWTGFGRYRAPKYMKWHKMSLRPAGYGDAESFRANARITDLATTTANADSALSNRVSTTEANYSGVRNDLNTWNNDRYNQTVAVDARVAREETARADAVSAVANRTSVVEAQISNDSNNLVRNGTFNAPGWGHGGGIPPYWGGWSQDNGAYIGTTDRTSMYGAPYPLQIDRNGINNGITQRINGPLAPGWYAFEVDVVGEDGNWSGSGIHCNFNNGSVLTYGFATNADTAGRYGDIGNATRRFTVLFKNEAQSDGANIYLMSGWSGFQGGTNFGFVRIVWHRIVMRPATDGEIKAQKVIDANLIARVGINESAVVDARNKLAAARLELSAVAGNNRAQITLRSDNNSGAGVDIVGDVNFAGNLNVGADSGGNRMKITNQNIQVFDGNGTRRVAFGLNF